MRLALPLLFLSVFACDGGEDDKDSGRPPRDSGDTAADTDTSGDTDTDTDTDTNTDSGALATYEDFVTAEARVYCEQLQACEYLDDRGYADLNACVTDQEARLGAIDCPEYNSGAANECISQTMSQSTDCSRWTDMLPPRMCNDVCNPREDSGTP